LVLQFIQNYKFSSRLFISLQYANIDHKIVNLC